VSEVSEVSKVSKLSGVVSGAYSACGNRDYSQFCLRPNGLLPNA
jgi:hypothetical protein